MLTTQTQIAAIQALANLAPKLAKQHRDLLKEDFTHELPTEITIGLGGSLKVGETERDVAHPQSLKPWNMVSVLLEEVNLMREAAGKAGIDLAQVITMAQAMDPKVATRAKKQAEELAAGLLETTRKDRVGKCIPKDVTLTILSVTMED